MRRRLDIRRQLRHQSELIGSGRKRGEFSQDIGRSRGGCGSTVHVAVNDLGRRLCLDVTGVQPHDSKVYDAFLNWHAAPLAIVAHKACGSAAICQANADEGAVAVVPSKSNAKMPIPHDLN